jgi:hypothetical protein
VEQLNLGAVLSEKGEFSKMWIVTMMVSTMYQMQMEDCWCL